MERKIGKFETAPAVANDFACFNLVGILKLEHAPSAEIVQKSLDILQNHHPALRTRINKIKDSYRFSDQAIQKIPLKVEERTDDNQWIPKVESYLNNPVDWAAGPLLNCTYLKNSNPPGVAEIIFAFHHSIVDANSLVIFLEDFLNICAAQQAGVPIEGYGGYPALPAVEDMFPRLYKGLPMVFRTMGFMMRQMASEMVIMWKTKGKRKPPLDLDSVAHVLTMTLDEEDTTALVKSVRKHKVTLNSVQHAAILTATWKHLYEEDSIPAKHILFQNLRPYLSPPLEEDVLGSYIAMIQLVIELDSKRDFWDLSREINQAVYSTGKSGDKFISANLSGALLKMLFRFKSFRMALTAMNYSGAISLQKNYGDIKVVDVHGFSSNFGLGPEFSAQTLMYKGKLYWNIVYLDTDMNGETAQAITDEIKYILVSAAKGKNNSD
ncbi:condensation domain-containing protein [Chloroflexota bacterium]